MHRICENNSAKIGEESEGDSGGVCLGAEDVCL